MDLAAFFAETAASIEARDTPEFPGFPVSRSPSGNGQAIDNESVSRISRISRPAKEGGGLSDDVWPQAGAGVRASARTRGAIAGEREIREMREMPASSDTYISRHPSIKREKERETGNPEPLPVVLPAAEAPACQPPSPLDGPLLPIWRASLARLSPSVIPAPGYTLAGWQAVRGRALTFLDAFGEQAEALGWDGHRLFNVHPEVGIVRVDHCGALVLPIGGPVRAITADTISFGHLTHREKPGQPQGIPIWEFGR